MTFRLSHPIAWFPERQLGQNTTMLSGNGQANDHSSQLLQAIEYGPAHNCSKLVGDNHRRLFERRPATLFQVFVGAGRRRIFVIAFYVLAMMASTKAARIAIKPRTICLIALNLQHSLGKDMADISLALVSNVLPRKHDICPSHGFRTFRCCDVESFPLPSPREADRGLGESRMLDYVVYKQKSATAARAKVGWWYRGWQ